MLEGDAPGVQELPGEVEVSPHVAASVERVSHHMVSDVTHVDADLVRATGVEVALEQAVAVVAHARLKALERPEAGDGLPGRRIVAYGHAQAVACGAGNARGDGPLVGDNVALDERDVASVERPQADEVLKGALGPIILGGDHETRGVHVEAVHDARTVVTLKVAQMPVAAVGHEGVRERVTRVPGTRVTDEPRLLGEHDEPLVLKTHVERNGKVGGKRPWILLVGQQRLDAVAEHDALRLGAAPCAVDADRTPLDEPGAGRARGGTVLGGEEGVEPHAVRAGTHEG